MAPFQDDSDSDEAPEAFSLSQTKGAAQKRNAALRELEAAEKQKKRIKNQERDRKLKEQAQASKKRKIEAEAEGSEDDENEGAVENDVEARMLRAMQQAEEEDSDAEENDSGMEEGEVEIDSEEEGENESEEAEDNVDMDEEESSDDDMETEELKSKSNHLPDHLFTSAFSSKPKKKPTSPSIPKNYQKQKKARRKRSGNAPKDLIVGSRAVRTLPQIDKAPRASAAMLPSAKVQKFLDRNLSVKGDKSRTRGWERRAANIGSMRRQGPAAHFVRAS